MARTPRANDESALPLSETIDPHVLPDSKNAPHLTQTGNPWSGGVASENPVQLTRSQRRIAITIVRPETVVRWHRMGFAAYWRWKSHSPGGRPRIGKETRDPFV
jgi:hypothetical protein